MENISILGSTGSIGKNCLKIVDRHRDRFKVFALAAGQNLVDLKKQVIKYQPALAVIWRKEDADRLRRAVGRNTRILHGLEGLKEASSHQKVSIVLNALVGAIGLLPTIEAAKSGKKIALANKETLVIGGEVINKILKRSKASLIPVDSEHSALHQCLNGSMSEEIERILLTASGGPFLNTKRSHFRKITPGQALKHPNWNMGNKITIDSATLMNKGLEVIEAHYLFKIPYNKIDVIMHPQSIIHSMVQYRDGSVIAQLGPPDMKIPILYALTYPRKWTLNVPRVDFNRIRDLTFCSPDKKKFRCLALAYKAGKKGGTLPAVMNAANEIAVERFLRKEITFDAIPNFIESAMQSHKVVPKPTITNIIEADRETRTRLARGE